MSVSAVQPSDSVLYTLFLIFFSVMVYYSILNSSLHYTVGPCYLSILCKILGWPKCSFKVFPKILHKMNILTSSIKLHLLIPNSQSIPPPHLLPSIPVSHICLVRYIHLFYILDSPYKWYHMVFVFLFLTYFTEHHHLQVHPCSCKWHYFILLYGWVIFYCVYSFVDGHI